VTGDESFDGRSATESVTDDKGASVRLCAPSTPAEAMLVREARACAGASFHFFRDSSGILNEYPKCDFALREVRRIVERAFLI
jgi:hypothetical protein